jgi:ABC-type multidrug transport system ATPase subunit
MVTSPSILFLDEPTSGLDSKNALRVMKAVVNLCKAGCTVICTIHQPRSNVFTLFDKLLLLSEGRVTYYGKASDSLSHFSSLGYNCSAFMNPADFLLDLLDEETEDTESKIFYFFFLT